MMKQFLAFSIVILLTVSGCNELENTPLVTTDGKPNPVQNIQVENLPGGARISYTLPPDKDFSYVEAVFASHESGEKRTVKSSLYKNFVELEGFAVEGEYQIDLYSVNRSEVKSNPVSATIKPLTAPISTVFDSLQIREDFGGVNVQVFNDPENEYILYTLLKDDQGAWTVYDRLYTKAKYRNYSVRGLEPEEMEFAFVLADKWENLSDTLKLMLTPYYEEQFEKDWLALHLPGDAWEGAYGLTLDKLWDGSLANVDYFIGNIPTPPLPNHFTIDLRKPLKISRMKVNQYTFGYQYGLGNPKTFEIWGSNDPPADGGWDNWTLLLQAESIKPSGLPGTAFTNEDTAYAVAGEEYDFPLETDTYRYIRFKTIKTWGGSENILLHEITLWGQNPNR
ncbi:DUF5000 domain-containing lipoprotein [Parapedobacter pyrenivorans]|uniref:DUF5000 domain-containing lipoprotein n=1 Tax=Parapedobacter pyrenivorans TaxID=1305674 RepID=UPI0033402335